MPFIAFIAAFGVALALRRLALMDPDTGWHIAAGDLIRAKGVPTENPWTFAADDAHWYNISWLYDIGLSRLHQAGGLDAVVVATALIYALAVGLVAAIAMRSSKSAIATFVATAIVANTLLAGALARPQLLSFILVPAFYALLRYGGRKGLFALPLLAAFWANAHGGFLAGFVIIGAFAFEALFVDRRRFLEISAAGLACCAAILANPYGWSVIEATQLTMNSALKDHIMEWRPTDLAIGGANWILVIAAVGASAFFEKSIPLADRLLAAFWLIIGVSSARMIHIAALLSAPYLAQAIALRLRAAPFAAVLAARDQVYATDLARPAARGAFALISALFIVAAFAPAAQRSMSEPGKAFAEIPDEDAPEAALDYLDAHHRDARIFADYGYGGYILYRDGGGRKVFLDGRADTAYPRAVIEDAIKIGHWDIKMRPDEESRAEWRRLVDRYQIDGFLTRNGGQLAGELELDTDWRRVFRDKHVAIYVRARQVTVAAL
jgi:hypothetical protein